VTRILVLAVLAMVVVAPTGPATAQDCDHSRVPFAGLPGAELTPTDHVSSDTPPVHYTLWRGFVPGFDGMPFSVDVTIPCGTTGELPLVTMAHGFGDDKTVWQETGKSDSVESEARPETNTRWNNIWFASKGYAVLNYTARGWHDSCGPAVPGAIPGVAPAPHCAAYEYWIHLDDKRWEVRDAQWLTAGLVGSGIADPDRLAITGGSYGGGPASMGALQGGRVMCGGAAMPAELGSDPCAGREDGEFAPWTTPDGRTPLTWAASVPLYTFADLIAVLAPNGRGTDGQPHAPEHGDVTNPFGVPISSTVAGLLAAGQSSGYFAPPGVDPTADIITDAARLLAGNPFPQDDPLVARGVRLYRDFKSPITSVPLQRVPIFWVQGFTDPLFGGLEALQMRNRLRALDPGYPIKVFLGDIGHDYTGQRADEWELVRGQANDFIDHYLADGPAPRFDVGATVTRCLDHDAPMRYESAPTWGALQPDRITFTSDEPGVTNTAAPGPAGLATDPISGASLPLPGSYKGCRMMSPSQPDPTAATYEFPAESELVLMGGPVVDITYSATAVDVPLAVRLWDVAADGSVQGLVTRGVYRSDDAPGQGLRARFQIAPNGYRFPAGHRVKLEVTANDEPYLQASRIPGVVNIEAVSLTLPLLERGRAPRDGGPRDGGPDPGSQPGGGGSAPPPQAPVLPATGGGARTGGGAATGGVLLGAGLLLLGALRPRRYTRRRP
jgi:hypothetical protein